MVDGAPVPNHYLVMESSNQFNRPQDKSAIENHFSYLSTKTYVVGTQKNRPSETVLLSTLDIH